MNLPKTSGTLGNFLKDNWLHHVQLEIKNLKERQCYIKEHGRHAAIQMKVWKSKFYATHDIIINVDHIIEIEYNNKALI